MTHEGTVHLIGDLLQGRLTGTVRDDVVSHVRSCGECRALSETHATLSAAFDDAGGQREHPASELLVRYALGEEGLGEQERDWVASHVLQCGLCASDLEAIGESEAELARDDEPQVAGLPTRSTRPAPYVPAVAAAFVVALLAYPAYLGLFEVPRINERIAFLEGQRETVAPAPTWDGGPVHQHILSGPLRGTVGDPEVVRVAGDQPFVTLNVEPGSFEELATGVTRFSVLDGAGVSLWSRDLTADQIRSYMRETETIEFIVPASVLPSGPLTLAVSRGAERLFDAPLVIEREQTRDQLPTARKAPQ